MIDFILNVLANLVVPLVILLAVLVAILCLGRTRFQKLRRSVADWWRNTLGEKPKFDAQPSPAAPESVHIWNVPIHRNPMFTGREDVLAELEKELKSGKPAALTQAIHGLGGIGKTQTAAEFAWRHATDYDVVWWVQSEKPELLLGGFSSLAAKLGMADAQTSKAEEVREFVREWLRTNERWLIIFDNAEKPEDIRDWLPQGPGQVLITSRHSTWGTTAWAVNLAVWPEGEAVDFLCKRTGCTDRTGAKELAEELGRLPLALEQAAAYIEHTKTDFAGYLKLYRAQRTALLGKKLSAPSTEYADTVLTTWSLSFDKVKSACPAAIDLLNLIAFLAPDDIPREILIEGAEFLPEDLAKTVQDDGLFGEAVAALTDYSLIKREGEALSVHRMVQAVVRDRMRENEQKRWAEAAVKIVNGAFPYDADDVHTWPVCARLMNHAVAAVEHGERLNVAAEATQHVLNQLGLYSDGRAEYPEAKELYERARPIAEGAYGRDHPEVAAIESNLGGVLRALGDLKGAKEWYERALKIGDKAFGPDHPDVATYVNNLGTVLSDLGDLKGARECFERALPIIEKTRGADHPSVAPLVNNLGSVLQDLGDLKGARGCFERALPMIEKTRGADHPNVATLVNNIGSVLQDLGDLKGAKECFERALKIDEKAFGPDHPNVAIRLNNLGGVLQNLGDLDGAKKCFERALKIDDKAFGPDHAKVAIRVNNLGSVLRASGDLKRARECFERALKIDEKAVGPDHPTVAIDVNNLGRVLKDQGDLKGAKECFERAHRMFMNVLGPDHPHTKLVKENLDGLG